MLLRLSLKNWMSFKTETEFCLIAGREKQHSGRLPRIPKYRLRILPAVAVYGGNASGKSNLFRAVLFAQRFVVGGTQPDEPVPVEPFMLDRTSSGVPSGFYFQLLVDETIYELRFEVTRSKVVSESLTKILSTREVLLYSRTVEGIQFGEGLQDDDFMVFAYQGTRENELFLTNAVSQNVELFRPVYDWFRRTL
ncbi:MAG: AAA family ATPase, partial [Coriobacteriia bacterium]|nr:AAA family ATPase [Coriobacteriia bacterium]